MLRFKAHGRSGAIGLAALANIRALTSQRVGRVDLQARLAVGQKEDLAVDDRVQGAARGGRPAHVVEQLAEVDAVGGG